MVGGYVAVVTSASSNGVGTTEDIEKGVLWLVSDKSFVSGQNIQLSGGASLGRLPKSHEMAAQAAE